VHMFGNLFIRSNRNQSLDAFVEDLAKQLGCGQFEERQSSNYVNERYFRCSALGIAVEVALADESEFEAYQFWLCFQPDGVHVDDKSFFDGLADCVARKLVTSGWEVVRPLSFGRAGGGAIAYRRNPAENCGLRERVLVEEI